MRSGISGSGIHRRDMGRWRMWRGESQVYYLQSREFFLACFKRQNIKVPGGRQDLLKKKWNAWLRILMFHSLAPPLTKFSGKKKNSLGSMRVVCVCLTEAVVEASCTPILTVHKVLISCEQNGGRQTFFFVFGYLATSVFARCFVFLFDNTLALCTDSCSWRTVKYGKWFWIWDMSRGSLLRVLNIYHMKSSWDAWVVQWLNIFLWLRSWSWGPGIESCISLPVGILLLPLPVSLLSLCVSHE